VQPVSSFASNHRAVCFRRRAGGKYDLAGVLIRVPRAEERVWERRWRRATVGDVAS
jgi:hypothetical protein